MSRTVVRNKSGASRIILTLIFGWIGIWEIQYSQDVENDRSRALVIAIGILGILFAISLILASIIKRVVLDGDILKVYWGVRISVFNRSDISAVKYGEGTQVFAGYTTAYPVLERTNGDDVALLLLARGGSGVGERQIDEYVSIMNKWAAEGREP